MKNINVRLATFAVAGLAALLSAPAFAGGSSASHIDSKGGLSISDSNENYWFRLGGRLQFDGVNFHGDHSDLTNGNPTAPTSGFASGTNIRRAQLSLSGGVGNNWVYGLLTEFNQFNSTNVVIKDAYLGYTGFDNAYVAIGQTSVPFGLEDAMDNGSSLFMERSLMSYAVDPGFDLGVYGDMQFENKVSVMGGIYTPNANVTQIVGADFATIGYSSSDPLSYAGRVVFAPVNTAHEVWHFGASGLYANNHYHGSVADFGFAAPSVSFSTVPEIFSRSTAVLSTNTIYGVKDYQIYGLEAAFKQGPWFAAAEHQMIHLNRDRATLALANDTLTQGSTDLNFHGFSLMASYVITGESRGYDARMGSFGSVVPKNKNGAWDVSARYSMAKLGTGPIGDGTEHNVTLGTSWYYNKNVRFLANYIRANKPNDVDLNIFGVRAQVIW